MILLQAQPVTSRWTALSDWLDTTAGVPFEIQRRLLVSLVVLATLFFLRRLALRLVRRRVREPRTLYQWAKVSSYVTTLLAVLLVGPIWLEGVSSFGTFLGLVTAGVAIALKDPLTNLAGWAYIMWRRPFELGDRIEIGGRAGDVVDIAMFKFTILEIGNWVDADQSTGRIIHIPNAQLFSQSVANSTAEFPYIWNEVPVLITFESNWRAAKELVEAAVREVTPASEEEVRRSMRRASEKFLIFYERITPIVYVTVRDSGVLLTARYLCDPRSRRGSSEGVWTRILDAFDARDDVGLAYPTYRVTGVEDGLPSG